MNKEQLIEQMEDFCAVALKRLEEYQEVERDYQRAAKALKVLRGEGAGENGTKAKSKAVNGIKRAAKGKQDTASLIRTILKKHKDGMTIKQLQAEMAASGHPFAEVTLFHRLKVMAAQKEVVKESNGPGSKGIYRL